MDSQNFTLGIVADAQYCDTPARDDLQFRLSPDKLSQALDFFAEKNVDACVQLGDLIDHDFASYSRMLPLLESCDYPVFNILGNHEFIIAEEEKAHLPELLQMPSRFYKKSFGNWRLLFLDGNDISFNAVAEESPEYKEVQKYYDSFIAPSPWWNGALGAEQLKWLEAELKEAQEEGAHVIIFCHFPIIPDDKYCLWNRAEVLELIESFSCAKAWMNGHRHAGSYDIQNSIVHWSAQAMLLSQENAYALLHLTEEGFSIEGFGRQESY
jgi:manganese-dependent ADP-ribose/CDP-alcohol diphosphatase